MNIAQEFDLDIESFIWQDLAMCEGMGQTNIHFDDAESDPAIARAAKEVCGYCPVKEMCLQYGQDNKATGIFGGRYLQAGRIND